jgi:hypothetical protein
MEGLIDHAKTSAFREYIRARKILHYNLNFKRPGQATFVKVGRAHTAALEKMYPDFRDAFSKLHGAKYDEGA